MSWELQFVTMTENQIDKKKKQHLGNHNIYGKGKKQQASCNRKLCLSNVLEGSENINKTADEHDPVDIIYLDFKKL